MSDKKRETMAKEEEQNMNESKERILELASKIPHKFLPGSLDDFTEKVEAVCEPGNRSLYSTPTFSYLQARLTGKTRMLLARKRGVYNLYISCSRRAIYKELLCTASGRSDKKMSSVLGSMVLRFAEYLMERSGVPCGAFVAEDVFKNGLSCDTNPFTKASELLKELRNRKDGEAGRIVLSFDDAHLMLKDRVSVYVQSSAPERMVKRNVNMLRWIRHAMSTEVSGDFFWSAPCCFTSTSPEIDKTDPLRSGECPLIFPVNEQRIFMPLILHDSFDLFTEFPQRTAMSLNQGLLWVEHLKTNKYLYELAFHGRPAWGALMLALLSEYRNDYSSHSLFEAFLGILIPETQIPEDFANILTAENSGTYSYEAVIVMIMGSSLGVFDIHSTNLNLLFAKRHFSELLALDMDGRVCFSTFPSEPLVACQLTSLLTKYHTRVIDGAIDLYHLGLFTFDSRRVFVAQVALLLAAQLSKCVGPSAWSSTCLQAVIPRQCSSFLEHLLDSPSTNRFLEANGFRDILDGAIAFSHFATVDMDDLAEELGRMGFVDAELEAKGMRVTRLDAIQLGFTLSRLIGRNAVGMVGDPWRGVDLIIPVVCVTGQLGAILISVSSGLDHSELDQTLLDLSHFDPNLFLKDCGGQTKKKLTCAIPTIGIIFRLSDTPSQASECQVKQLDRAVKITVSKLPKAVPNYSGLLHLWHAESE